MPRWATGALPHPTALYDARGHADHIAVLARKVPSHAGTHATASIALGEAIERLYREHPRWSFQLHHLRANRHTVDRVCEAPPSDDLPF